MGFYGLIVQRKIIPTVKEYINSGYMVHEVIELMAAATDQSNLVEP